MDEQKNNLENNNPENLDYSFDFANQVEPEVQSQETVAVEPAPAEPQMVDVSVPVTDQPVQVQETVTVEQTQQPAETTEELKDSKSTLRFVIILAVIIVAFIIALPFVLNLLGY